MVSLCIYGLVIALAILFANTTHASHGSVHPCPPASALALCISLPSMGCISPSSGSVGRIVSYSWCATLSDASAVVSLLSFVCLFPVDVFGPFRFRCSRGCEDVMPCCIQRVGCSWLEGLESQDSSSHWASLRCHLSAVAVRIFTLALSSTEPSSCTEAYLSAWTSCMRG